jgi:UDP-N-acetyl-D-glucosamine dehydrogenase
MRLLRQRGAVVRYHDPLVPALAAAAQGPAERSVPLTARELRKVDCAVIVTDHSLVDYQLVTDTCPVVVDARNATRNVKRNRSRIIKL